MTDSDDFDRIEDGLARLRALADAELHVHLEHAAATTPDYSWPPAPSTEHPWMARYARFVREQMRDGREYRVLLAAPRTPIARFIAADDPPEIAEPPDHIVLDIKQWAGPAPYVGDPFAWMWRTAVDQFGRWVAGDSWAEPMPPWVQWREGRS